MKSSTEVEYLRANSKFEIERKLLNSMSDTELKDFIQELYEEYKHLENFLKKQYENTISWYPWLSKLSFYLIELLIYSYSEEWQEYIKLKKILEGIDFHLDKEEAKEYFWEKYGEIDIQSIPISDVIWRYTKLPRNLRKNITCPFSYHRDKTASFRIYEDSNRFHCFWCNRSWDGVNFISHMENYSNTEAFKIFTNLYFK